MQTAIDYLNEGIAFGEMDDYDNAIACFDEAIRLDPNFADAYHSRGVAYRDKADLGKAIPDIKRAKELDPTIGQ